MNIVGEKVVLRPITMDDTDNIVKWRNNPSVRNNFIFRETFTPEIHNNWMKSKVFTGQVVQYIIEDKETSKPVGSIYFRDIDKNNESAEFGIFIGEDCARGKGFGSEATKLFVDFGLAELKLHRIFLRVLDENKSAIKSYINAGFQQEGVFHHMLKIDNEYRDVVFMAVFSEK